MATRGAAITLLEKESEESDSRRYEVVCSLSELQRLGRKRVALDERVVVLFYVEGNIYALDHFCYRM